VESKRKLMLAAGLVLWGTVQAASLSAQGQYWRFVAVDIVVERELPDPPLPAETPARIFKINHLIWADREYESTDPAGDRLRLIVRSDRAGRLEIRVSENGEDWTCYRGPAEKCGSIRVDFTGNDRARYHLNITLKPGTFGKFR